MSYCVVIPAYNEAKRLKNVLQDLWQNNVKHIIVVDDGSTDGLDKLPELQKVVFTKHLINLGQGGALKTGTMLAKELGFEIVVHFDADGQHRVEDLLEIVKHLNNNEHDVVLGSRFMQSKSDLPLKKKIILNLARIFSKKFLMLEFTDPQSGLRGFKINILHKLDWQNDDFTHCSEILSLIRKNKLKFKEIPIIVNYNSDDQSKASRPQLRMGWKLIISKIFNKI